MAQRIPGVRRLLPRCVALGLALAVMIGGAACSVIVENRTDQCSADADCEAFGGYPQCVEGVCVARDLNPPGCFPYEPAETSQYLNQCTGAECTPFDNCARLGLCGGATLPPLSPPPAP